MKKILLPIQLIYVNIHGMGAFALLLYVKHAISRCFKRLYVYCLMKQKLLHEKLIVIRI